MQNSGVTWMNKPTDEQIRQAVDLLRNANIDAKDGLSSELFWLVSSLIPIANVDLLVVNPKKGELLLERRNDSFYEKSWHIPGGCIRYGETMLHRVQETALEELHSTVEITPEPLAICDVLRGPNPVQQYPNERGHNITILFQCKLPENYLIDNGNLREEDQGYLRWFSKLPPDFMKLQNVYKYLLDPWR